MDATLPGEQPSDADGLPSRIGRYHILQRLGEGGMGVVYLAEQREPISRRVAVKAIKLGMDTKAVLARFHAEQQALALMEHSCIAKVLDAGVAADGRPYFVMEYIAGIPITDYCDSERLPTAERIRLFMRVCSAMQHAHERGIVHRDLKPSNVLVTARDGQAEPRVIDFGLAKALNHRLVAETIFTEQGQVIGTPEYMSPEQAGGDPLGIDARTDIYSLGVLLYELLAGCLPFSRTEAGSGSLLDLQQRIRDGRPERPSDRLSRLADRAADVAARRQGTVRALRAELRRHLDPVVLKALQRDRTRRYQTAAEFGSDLDRYLRGARTKARLPRFRGLRSANRWLISGIAAAVLVAAVLMATTRRTVWRIAVVVDPPDASVFIDGERVGQGFLPVHTFDLSHQGRSYLQAVHPDYHPAFEWFTADTLDKLHEQRLPIRLMLRAR